MIIKESDSCIIKMPSGNYKIVHLLPNQRVDLGKFGSFPTNNLFGNHFGIPLEIVGDDLIRVQQSDFLACFDIDIKKDNGQTNDQITQNKQNLSQEEIEELKKQNVNHLVIIENLAKNNVNYNEKTEYAKAKYINRKLKKFSKVFIPLRVNSLNLLDYYTAKNPERIRELRVDTLSQILTHANVRAGSRLLVADDTGGLLGTAICERAGKNSDIYFIHDGKTPALELMKQANITHFHTYPWYRFTEPLVEQEITTDDVVAIERKQTRFAKLVQEDQTIKAGGFDALIIASKFDPLEVLTKLEPFLAYSAQVVCYAPRKEMLLQAYNYIRLSPQYVNTQLTESWMREYQVPIVSSGTHPHMMTNGNGGFVFHGTLVHDDNVIITKPPLKKKARKDRN